MWSVVEDRAAETTRCTPHAGGGARFFLLHSGLALFQTKKYFTFKRKKLEKHIRSN